jgi:hypothetical protein
MQKRKNTTRETQTEEQKDRRALQTLVSGTSSKVRVLNIRAWSL